MTSKPTTVLFCVSVLTIAAFAGLIPSGRWQGDDFFGYWVVHEWKSGYLRFRILGASPRPLAELLNYLYFSLARALHRPLIEIALFATWGIAAGLVGSAALLVRRTRAAVLLLALTALLLELRKPSEMFYWPVGAFPYLIGTAALAAVSLLHLVPITTGRRLLTLFGFLLLAELSNEVAASAVGIYSVLFLLALGRRSSWPRRIQLFANGAIAALVGFGVFRGRIHTYDLVAHPHTGFVVESERFVFQAAGLFLRVLASGPLPGDLSQPPSILSRTVWLGLATTLVVFLACRRRQDEPRPDVGPATVWIISLVTACFLSIQMALEQFGAYCCERHASMQSAMVLLALFTGGSLLAVRSASRQTTGLALLVILGLLTSIPALRSDYHTMNRELATRRANWASLLASGPNAQVEMLPRGRIVNFAALTEGHFLRSAGNQNLPWEALGIMGGFDKASLTVRLLPGPRR
jgi:hypothetical protein